MDSAGRLLLRIEDIDSSRCRPEYEEAIKVDLQWLGISWDGPAVRQSERMDRYAAALGRLQDLDLLYPCSCTRREIEAALAAPQEGDILPSTSYPGTCRPEHGGSRHPDRPSCLRLHMERAFSVLGGTDTVETLAIEETDRKPGTKQKARLDPKRLLQEHGDVVLARKDVPASYHLAVIVDDAEQGVTSVTRGEDLRSMTPLHRLLQALLDLPAPAYIHHALIRDEHGRRLAKRDQSLTLRSLREAGVSPQQVTDALNRPAEAVAALRSFT